MSLHLFYHFATLVTVIRIVCICSSFSHTANEISSIIDELLTHYPEAASLPNKEGRLPLQIAIATGQLYYGALKNILCASPPALGRIDQETELFPFMLAATEKVNGLQSTNETQDSLEQLSTIYLLLKDDPTLVIYGIQPRRGMKRKRC